MKINVKINEKSWKYYLRKPENIIKKKVTLLNKNIKFLSKNKFIVTIKKVKKEYFINNFDKLWIHGLLHLLGYTHKKDKEHKKMLKLERIYYDIVS